MVLVYLFFMHRLKILINSKAFFEQRKVIEDFYLTAHEIAYLVIPTVFFCSRAIVTSIAMFPTSYIKHKSCRTQ